MLVASIDVGIINLGVAFVEVNDGSYRLERIMHVEHVDTTIFRHTVVTAAACTLGHTKTATDRIMHFIQERAALFEQCAVVLIERQPIQGHTDVEQVLFMHFRDKAELVSPNSMHKLLQINHLTYEWRKVKTVEFADTMLDPDQFPEYHTMTRRHDVADALCLLIYWAYSHHLRTNETEEEAAVQPDKVVVPAGTTHAESEAATQAQAPASPDQGETGTREETNPFGKYKFVPRTPLFARGK